MTPRSWPVERESYVLERYEAGASIKQITRELGGGERSVGEVVKRHGLKPLIGSSKIGSEKRPFDPEKLAIVKEMWDDGQPVVRIIRRIGWTEAVVKRALVHLGFTFEPRQFQGERHHLWRGGSTNADGYRKVMVYAGDPMFPMRDAKGYVLEHRLVMARALGRPLRRGESVHHVNGVKDDNRLENLQLRQGKHGKGIVARCACCGSRDIVFDELE